MVCFLIVQQSLNQSGPTLIGHLDPAWYWRACCSLIVSLMVVWWAKGRILTQDHSGKVPYVIAFNITIFVIFGLALAVTASREWATACMCAGACLLGGGLIGLLFGIPYGRTASDMMAGGASSVPTNGSPTVPGTSKTGSDGSREGVETIAPAAQQSARQPVAGVVQVGQAQPVAAMTSPPQLAPAQLASQETPKPTADRDGNSHDENARAAAKTQAATGRNLLEDTASSLSKLLTGASLVKIASIYHFFQKISWTVGYYLTDGNLGSAGGTNAQYASSNIAVLGGSLILYFLMLGFLSGLFLPAYFMKGWDN
jgi:hypothetical protein